tara:strand:+ start:361 stop:1650 length:1290 start_codon:yes stop_codon:yes gene_type:complete
MTRKDPIETAKAILEGKSSTDEMKMDAKEMKMEMAAMKEAMMKELHDNGASEKEIAEMMKKMEAMSYKEMKEMMAKEGIKYEMKMDEESEEDLEEKKSVKEEEEDDDDDDDEDDDDEDELDEMSVPAELKKKGLDSKPDASRAEVEGDLETLKKAKGAKKSSTKNDGTGSVKMDKPSMKEDLDALFTGEELTEDFKEKAAVIFESAINMRVESLREEIEAESAAQLEEDKEEFRNELSAKMDDYLSYVVEQWMKDNELAVERGLKGDIAESFMTGLKGLFEDHYITVPDDKYDLLEGLYEKVSGLETKLNEEIKKNTELNKDAMVSRCINVFTEVAEGLTDTENEKLKSLAEGLEYDSEDQFRDKLTVLRENYFDNVSETNELANEIVGDTINESAEEVHAPSLDGPMKFYSDMLTRSATVEKQTNFKG